MAVTPKGIWTPDNSDQYDLIVDAAATANSIDQAISKTATTLAGLGTGAYAGQWGWVTGGGGAAYQWTGTGWRAREVDDTGWINLFPAAGVTGTVRYRVINRVAHFEVDVTTGSVPANEVSQIATGVPAPHRPTVPYAPLNMFRGSFFQNVAPAVVSASSGTLSVRNPLSASYAGAWMGTGSYALP